MRIAFITHKFVVPSETFVRDLALGLAARGHDVEIVCDSLSREGRAFTELKLHPCGFRMIKRAIKPCASLAGLHSRLSHAFATQAIARQLKKIRPDAVYGEFGTNTADAIDAIKRFNLPLVIGFHGFDVTAAMRTAGYKQYIGQALDYAYGAISPSAHLKRMLVIGGADGAKIHVVHDGIIAEKCVAPDWDAKLKGPPTVVSVGRFVAKKNPLALIEAYRIVHAKMPEARFTMVGGGKLEGETRARIRKYGLENCVTMKGVLSHEDTLRCVADAWVFAQNSATSIDGDQEGMPVSIQEAMACGLPVVSTLHSGIPEAVQDGEHGYLVLENDYEKLAERILSLLNNSDTAQQLGAKGRETALQNFGNAVHVEKVDELLRGALNQNFSTK